MEEQARCVWCENEFDISELNHEIDIGYLCDRCVRAIESRGEHLEFEEN